MKKRMTDIALKLKKDTDSTSQALLITLELAVIKKYTPQSMPEFQSSLNTPIKLKQLYNKLFHHYSFKYNIADYCDEKTLKQITKHYIDASVEPEDIALFIQEFTIEKSKNELYEFSTPIELKKLMVSLLEIEDKDSVYNPCFGIGGLFNNISKSADNISVYGEEIEERYRLVGGLTAQLAGIKECKLYKRDVLYNSSCCFKNKCRKFDKVICNPPLSLSLDSKKLVDDVRFKKYGIPPTNASELAFLENALACMKTRAVVLVRLSILTRTGNEAKIRTSMAYDGKVQTIIALPKGIIPMLKEDMALIVLSHANKEIQFIDLNKPHFIKRKGRRNTIYRIDDILDIVLKKHLSQYATTIDINTIDPQNLSPQYYLNKINTNKNQIELSSITKSIYRAQRVSTANRNTDTYLELSINNIVKNGYTLTADISKHGDTNKINKFRLKEYDLLLPLRGKTTTVGIVGKINKTIVPNSGIIVIRLRKSHLTKNLYLYLNSTSGQDALKNIYAASSNNTINPDILGTILLPNSFGDNNDNTLDDIFYIQKQINENYIRIKALFDK